MVFKLLSCTHSPRKCCSEFIRFLQVDHTAESACFSVFLWRLTSFSGFMVPQYL